MKYWARSGQIKVLDKILGLFKELEEHPRTVTVIVVSAKGHYSGLYFI